MALPTTSSASLNRRQQPPVQSDGVVQSFVLFDAYDNQGNLLASIDGAGNLYANSYGSSEFPAKGTAATVIATAGTIPSTTGIVRLAPTAAVTGVIISPGTFTGQELTVINEAASTFTVTMAASGTSNVADGTGDAVAVTAARTYVWDDQTSLWYPMK